MFNYLGQLDTITRKGKSKWFEVAEESTGPAVSEDHIMDGKLFVNTHIRSGELIIQVAYSKNHYNSATMTLLAENYIKNLEWLILHCLEQGRSAAIFTPSDYGLAGEVTNEQLNTFLSGKKTNMDNILEF
jgi:non-ribosomal peptide synthase protein (TIGR01720 family)